jgi:predicted Fe-Mo cluster-binding NifX family protein
VIVCVPIKATGEIDHSWGRAPRVAVAEVRDGELARWDEFDVGLDRSHDAGTEGGHHASIATFLQEQGVQMVIASHMGDPMVKMLDSMGVDVRLGASGDAGRAVLFATAGQRD